MSNITNTTVDQIQIIDRPAVISVTGKKVLDRAVAVIESTGNNRALKMILAGEKGAVGKLCVADTVQTGWHIAIKHAAMGSGYDAFIGTVALKLKRAMKNNRATFVRLPEIIDDEILQGESGAKKMSEKAIDALYVLKAEIVEATAQVNALYAQMQEEKAQVEAMKANGQLATAA
jgi:predicted transcriptional regulator